MSKPKPILSNDLGRAICKHFGIDTEKHIVDSNFEIKTAPGGLATVKLTLMLSADDLAGIARAAGADGVQTFTATGHFCKPSPVATVAVDAETSETLRCYGGSAKADSRLDEVVTLLKRIEARLYWPIETVHVVPGA